MPPTAGAGANTALLDANLLRDKLIAAHRGELSVTEAVGEYEARMREYAFRCVHAAERNLRNAISDGRIGQAGFRSALRLVNRIGPLRHRMARAMTG